jgi:hypothetical protein
MGVGGFACTRHLSKGSDRDSTRVPSMIHEHEHESTASKSRSLLQSPFRFHRSGAGAAGGFKGYLGVWVYFDVFWDGMTSSSVPVPMASWHPESDFHPCVSPQIPSLCDCDCDCDYDCDYDCSCETTRATATAAL